MSEAAPGSSEVKGESKRGGPSRLRVVGARALTVLAILLALVGMLAFYVAHTALSDAGFEAVSRNMIENEAIRTQVANTAVDSLYENVDVEAAIAARLPRGAERIGSRAGGLSRSGADRAAGNCARATARPDGSGWRRRPGRSDNSCGCWTTRRSSQTEGGKVVLDLRPIVIQIGDQVAMIGQGGREAARVRREDHDRRREPTGDRSDDHADPARGRRLDVACRARRRGARNLGGPRPSQDRAPRARDRRARRRAADVGRAPRRRRVRRRPPREGRQRQTSGTRRVEHPDAGPRRPCLGVDRPRRRHAGRSLVRR